MFCPQCGIQAEQQTKFCKSCGLKLADHAQLIATTRDAEIGPMSREEAHRQSRWLKATRLLLINVPLIPLMMFTLGIAAAAHGGDEEVIGTLLTFLLAFIWLGINGRAIFNLLRGGFFKTYKERLIRAEAALLVQPTAPIGIPQPQENTSLSPDTNRIHPRIEAGSIAEPTTRELRQASGSSGRIQ